MEHLHVEPVLVFMHSHPLFAPWQYAWHSKIKCSMMCAQVSKTQTLNGTGSILHLDISASL